MSSQAVESNSRDLVKNVLNATSAGTNVERLTVALQYQQFAPQGSTQEQVTQAVAEFFKNPDHFLKKSETYTTLQRAAEGDKSSLEKVIQWIGPKDLKRQQNVIGSLRPSSQSGRLKQGLLQVYPTVMKVAKVLAVGAVIAAGVKYAPSWSSSDSHQASAVMDLSATNPSMPLSSKCPLDPMVAQSGLEQPRQVAPYAPLQAGDDNLSLQERAHRFVRTASRVAGTVFQGLIQIAKREISSHLGLPSTTPSAKAPLVPSEDLPVTNTSVPLESECPEQNPLLFVPSHDLVATCTQGATDYIRSRRIYENSELKRALHRCATAFRARRGVKQAEARVQKIARAPLSPSERAQVPGIVKSCIQGAPMEAFVPREQMMLNETTLSVMPKKGTSSLDPVERQGGGYLDTVVHLGYETVVADQQRLGTIPGTITRRFIKGVALPAIELTQKLSHVVPPLVQAAAQTVQETLAADVERLRTVPETMKNRFVTQVVRPAIDVATPVVQAAARMVVPPATELLRQTSRVASAVQAKLPTTISRQHKEEMLGSSVLLGGLGVLARFGLRMLHMVR